jgi:hypothetical protein
MAAALFAFFFFPLGGIRFVGRIDRAALMR